MLRPSHSAFRWLPLPAFHVVASTLEFLREDGKPSIPENGRPENERIKSRVLIDFNDATVTMKLRYYLVTQEPTCDSSST